MKHNTTLGIAIKGFTLMELMVTITIVAIIVMTAYPHVIQALQRMEARRIKSTFRNTINIAKSTSYAYHKRVFMCLINETGSCHRDNGKQLVLFFDNNGNNNYDPLIDDLIQYNDLDLKYARTYLRAGRRHYVRFSRNTGLPRGFMGHFKYCPKDSDNTNIYQVSFNKMGIVRDKPNAIHPTGCDSL